MEGKPAAEHELGKQALQSSRHSSLAGTSANASAEFHPRFHSSVFEPLDVGPAQLLWRGVCRLRNLQGPDSHLADHRADQ